MCKMSPAPETVGASSSDGAQVATPRAEAAGDDREEFTGLRITKRCVPAAVWSKEIRSGERPRQIVPFSRLADLGRGLQVRDRVVIGVLYERSHGLLHLRGEPYMEWRLTDLADPEPRRLMLHLRREACRHWRTSHVGAAAKRGSIFAILNPKLDDLPSRRSGDDQAPVVHVVAQSQLIKLGDCPSLGTCEMRGCGMPCNADVSERFCALHMRLTYASKRGRSHTGGNNLAHLLIEPKHKKRLGPVFSEEAPPPDHADKAKSNRTDMAMQLDGRRFLNVKANDNYVNSICSGARPDQTDTSLMPMLGRAFHGKEEMELDIATLRTDEKSKAERMLEHFLEQREAQEHPPSRQASSTGSLSSGARNRGRKPPTEQPKSLRQLLEEVSGKRVARRSTAGRKADVGEQGASSSAARAFAAVAHAASAASDTDPVTAATAVDATAVPGAAAALSASSPDSSPPGTSSIGSGATAAAVAPPRLAPAETQGLVQRLEAAGEDLEQLQAVLAAADALLPTVPSELAAAVGRLVLQSPRADIRQAAIAARRRWRAGCDDAMAAASAVSGATVARSQAAPVPAAPCGADQPLPPGGIGGHNGGAEAPLGIDGEVPREVEAKSDAPLSQPQGANTASPADGAVDFEQEDVVAKASLSPPGQELASDCRAPHGGA